MPTDENEVCKIITTLKNSSRGHDGIDIKIIKHIKHAIITPLVHLCNQSFTHGKIPNELKIANSNTYVAGTKQECPEQTPEFIWYILL